MTETKVGYVKDYFAKVGVAGIEVTDGHISTGDTIHIKDHTTDLTQQVDSIQLEHQSLQSLRGQPIRLPDPAGSISGRHPSLLGFAHPTRDQSVLSLLLLTHAQLQHMTDPYALT